MNQREMTRAGFLRLAAISGVGLGLGALSPAAAERGDAPGEGEAPVAPELLLAESLVIDGVVSPRRKQANTWPRAAGEIKKKTGIDAGAWVVSNLDDLPELNEAVELHGESVMRIDRAADLFEARRSGRHGLLYYAARGARLDGSLERLAQWRDGGLRIFQIGGRDTNELGGGVAEDDARLSAFGRRVVAELNRLNVVIDVSQCGRRTTLDVADATTQPVTACHTNADRLTRHPRNKSDKEIKAIAATGGVIGISAAGRLLRRDAAERAGVGDVVAHVEHVARIAGVDHVALASDGYLDGSHVYGADEGDASLNTYRRWFRVAAALVERGYTVEALKKLLGLNFLRVYQKILV